MARFPLHWDHNRRENGACAYGASRLFGYDIPFERALDLIEERVLPGRLETLVREGQTFILDGAHNQGAACKLKESIDGVDAVIVGINEDKNALEILKALSPLSDRWITTASESERALEPSGLAQMIRSLNAVKRVTSCESINEAIAASAGCKRVLICGSLYLVGEARTILHRKNS